MTRVLHWTKRKNKVQRDLFSIENAEIRYHWGFNLFKMLK